MSQTQLPSNTLGVAPAPVPAPAPTSHATDSSRILLGLMQLARVSDSPQAGGDLDGVISRHVLKNLLAALQFRDAATVRHSRHVARLSVGMAQHLGWEPHELQLLEVAALLHDIGKIGVPDNILFKPGELSPDEAELMALHSAVGVDVLQACHANHEILQMIGQSRIDYNGADSGYRRIGSDVHQGARILAVADAYDSLSTKQVYRDAKNHDEIMAILTDAAGTRFDGNIVSALDRWVETDGLPFADETIDPSQADGQSPTPGSPETNALCHIFSYLYVLESLYDGFFLVDADLRFTVWNRGVESLFGHSMQEMLGRTWTRGTLGYADKFGEPLSEDRCPMQQVIQDMKPHTSQLQLQHADGTVVSVEMQSVPIFDDQGTLRGVAEIFRDQSGSRRQPKEMRDLKAAASRDALTSVANRGELETQLARFVSDFADETAETFSIIFLDVDRFKQINDTFGHAVGDQVLVEVARLLQHETYSGELVARYGGEEFVVICPSTGVSEARRRAERLRLAISSADMEGLDGASMTASFGVTEVIAGDSIETLLERADKALYMAKQGGRDRTCVDAEAYVPDEAIIPAETAPVENSTKLYHTQFDACVAADMVVYKLGGFVTDERAKLKSVTSKQVVIRVGKAGMLRFWGRHASRQPVEVTLDFGEEETPEFGKRRGASQTIEIRVGIRAIGWPGSAETFQTRAAQVVKTLRGYFGSIT